jgi:hypothetical protein
LDIALERKVPAATNMANPKLFTSVVRSATILVVILKRKISSHYCDNQVPDDMGRVYSQNLYVKYT